MAKKTHIEAVIKTLSGKDVLGLLKETNDGLGKLRKDLAAGHAIASKVTSKLAKGEAVPASDRRKLENFLEKLNNYVNDDWPGNGGPIARSN